MKRKVVKALLELLPLFGGLFVVTAKPAPIDFEAYVGRYLAFILLFSSWALFRATFASLLPNRTDTTWRSASNFVLILFQLTVIVFAAVLFYRRFDTISYQFALLLVGVGALSTRLQASRNLWGFWISGLSYYSGLAFLSFQMVLLSWEWQTAIFSLAIGATSLSVMFADLRSEVRSEPSSRLSIAAAALGPVCIGFLVFTHALPNWYLLTFAVLPLVSSSGTGPTFARASSISLIFVVILGALAILA